MVLTDVELNLLFVEWKASELTLDRPGGGGGLTESGGIAEIECVSELSNKECSSWDECVVNVYGLKMLDNYNETKYNH